MKNAALTMETSNLISELSAMQRLVEILSDEQAALTESDSSEITKLVPEKEAALNACGCLSKARFDSMESLNIPRTPDGMRQWLEKVSGPSPQEKSSAGDIWSKLQQLTSQAKEMNRVNGMLIHKHSVLIEEILTKIRGGSTTTSTYGPNGKTRGGVQSRSLVVG